MMCLSYCTVSSVLMLVSEQISGENKLFTMISIFYSKISQAVVQKHNKPHPMLRIAALRGFFELTQN